MSLPTFLKKPAPVPAAAASKFPAASWTTAGTTVATILLPLLVLAVPIIDKLSNLGEGRKLKQLQELAKLVNTYEPEVEDLSDDELEAITSEPALSTKEVDLPAPADDELERAGLGWLMGGFPWAHGRTIITTRATEWEQQGEDSREVSATDLQHCGWCGAGSLTMLNSQSRAALTECHRA